MEENLGRLLPEERSLRKEERRQIRHTATFIGIVFLIMASIMCYWSKFAFYLCFILGIDWGDAVDFLSDSTVSDMLQIILSSLSFLFPYTLLCRMDGKRVSDIVSYGKPRDKSLVLPLLAFGLGVAIFASYATDIAGIIFEGFGVEYTSTTSEYTVPDNVYGYILAFVSTAVFPALLEEFAMRGIVLGVLKEYGEGFAIAVSGLLFGVMHLNFDQMPFAAILGVVLGFIAVKTGTVWVSVGVHFLNNAIYFFLGLLRYFLPLPAYYVLDTVIMLLLLVLGIVGLMAIRKKKDIFVLDKNGLHSGFFGKFAGFITSPTIIISGVFFLYAAFFLYRA